MARTVATLPAGARITDYISLGVITKAFPLTTVRSVLAASGKASLRERDLPAHVVMYYVIALALFMQASYREVLRCLLEGLQWLRDPAHPLKVASKSGISQARTRLGWEALRQLHDAVVRPIALPATRGAWYRQWRLVSLDGSTLDVADEAANAAAFGRPGSSREGLASPDLQLLFTPASYAKGVFRRLEREPGMTVAVCPVRPDSRGTIMAQSPDPFQYPAIRPNYLSALSDLRVLIAGINHTRRIFAQPAIARYSLKETVPGPGVTTDEQFSEFARQAGTNVFHPVGTCKMGTDPMAVVDPRLCVHGIAGLRVIDASIMPAVTTGNTNAPTIMIGEKGAAMIKEDARAGLAAAA